MGYIKTVSDLVKALSNIEFKDSEFNIIGNTGNSDDEDLDIAFDLIEVWDNGEYGITIFVGMNQKPPLDEEELKVIRFLKEKGLTGDDIETVSKLILDFKNT